MITTVFVLLVLCLAFAVFAGVLYWCCKKLGSREKKKFVHTSFIIREKELEQVLSTNPEGSKDESNDGTTENHNLVKNISKGEDFYAGKDSLRNQQKNQDKSGFFDNLNSPFDDEKFHAGMAKIRVFEEDDHVLGDTMSDRVLA